MKMKTAIHFGGGNIGRGFIGMLLSQAGYKVIFADVQDDIILALQQQKEYEVEIVGDKTEVISVKNVDGINVNDPKLIELIAQADMVTTAVGAHILPLIAPIIAKALDLSTQQNRRHSLPIIACENAVRATSQLKQYVKEHMAYPIADFACFVDAAVDRIVPPMKDSENILKVCVEDFYEWLVEKSAFKGDIPQIDGMTLVDDLEAGIERKLFTLNTGHAVCAWVGQYLGYQTIFDAIKDDRVKNLVRDVMRQSGEALIQKHGFDREVHHIYISKILKRFANPYIIDDVERVGRQPLRKLSQGERMASPMLAALQYGLPIDKLLIGVAAAMHFKSSEDPQAGELQDMIKHKDIEEVFNTISGMSLKNSPLEKIYKNLEKFI